MGSEYRCPLDVIKLAGEVFITRDIITRDSDVIMCSPCVFVCVWLSMFVTMFVRTI